LVVQYTDLCLLQVVLCYAGLASDYVVKKCVYVLATFLIFRLAIWIGVSMTTRRTQCAVCPVCRGHTFPGRRFRTCPDGRQLQSLRESRQVDYRQSVLMNLEGVLDALAPPVLACN